MWTQTKMNMALRDCPLCADLSRLQRQSAAAAAAAGEAFPLLENSIKTITELLSPILPVVLIELFTASEMQNSKRLEGI